ncbi:hypothetical protein [Rhizobium sp. RU36D]|uniref:hypothetical protein n=1 Tax=Rhizobium sp. RU36D TaxID=1907415 RepID=UPI0009D8E0E1|nr:hypothetical protein [Rhizobium sp. RU36D]SMC61800.1 hypothetical protein SAMN05880593_103264 [Rhizobium sp. RU36D]
MALMSKRILATFMFATVPTCFAMAEPGNEATARQIEQQYEALLGLPTGIVKVATATDGYQLVIDAPQLLQKFAVPGLVVEGLQSFAMQLKPTSNGDWQIEQSDSFDISGRYQQPPSLETLSLRYKVGSLTGSGLASHDFQIPKLMQLDMRDVSTSVVSGAYRSEQTAERITWDQSTDNVRDGLLDLKTDSTETKMKNAGQPDAWTADKLTSSIRMQGVPYLALQDLLDAWMKQVQLGKSTPDIAVALRPDLQQIMPIARGLQYTGAFEGFAASAQGMELKARNVTYSVDAANLAGDVDLGIGLSIDTLEVDDRLPAATAELLPDTVTMDVDVDELNFQRPWEYFIKSFSPQQALNDNQTALLMNYLLPKDQVKLDISESRVASSLYDVTAGGTVDFKIGAPRPAGQIKITAHRIDPLIAHLQKNVKQVPEFGQYAFFALAAKGFAQTGPDGGLVWDIEMDETGAVRINGRSFGGAPN